MKKIIKLQTMNHDHEVWFTIFNRYFNSYSQQAFKSIFHLSAPSMTCVFEKYLKHKFSEEEFLMALYFLVNNHKEEISCTMWKVSREKWRRTIWGVINFLSNEIDEIKLEERFDTFFYNNGVFSKMLL